MNTVFGPVPSRRLGRSLGIDPVPSKTCNWNCVYCQLGSTSRFTLHRKEFVPSAMILDQLDQALEEHGTTDIDWITFVGSGETCLNSALGDLIKAVKQRVDLPVAVITNGSLLSDPRVREELLLADAVMPSLDAANETLYKKINRPHHSLTLEKLVEGLELFRQEYLGKLWIEVMLIKGLNDDQTSLCQLTRTLKQIDPDEIHLILPTRPPTESWVAPPDRAGILQALLILGEKVRLFETAAGDFELNSTEELTDALISILTRHPMTTQAAVTSLERRAPGKGSAVIEELIDAGKIKRVTRQGKSFITMAEGKYRG